MDYSRILPNLYLGPCPRSPNDVDDLTHQIGITAVLNLQTDKDFQYWEIDWPAILEQYLARSILVSRMQVRDFDTEDLREKLGECVHALQGLLDSNHIVYLHCTAGAGRSPSVAIAYLILCRGLNLEEAASYVMKRHKCVPDLEGIRAATAQSAES